MSFYELCFAKHEGFCVYSTTPENMVKFCGPVFCRHINLTKQDSCMNHTCVNNIENGVTPGTLAQKCCHHTCSFKLKMYKNRFWPLRELTALPRARRGQDRTPPHFPLLQASTPLVFEMRLRQRGGPRAPEGIKMALISVSPRLFDSCTGGMRFANS